MAGARDRRKSSDATATASARALWTRSISRRGLARVKFEERDGRPYLGPWMPWKEIASGGIKSHIPPTVGEQVDVLSESGDLADGVIDMSTPSNENPRPA